MDRSGRVSRGLFGGLMEDSSLENAGGMLSPCFPEFFPAWSFSSFSTPFNAPKNQQVQPTVLLKITKKEEERKEKDNAMRQYLQVVSLLQRKVQAMKRFEFQGQISECNFPVRK